MKKVVVFSNSKDIHSDIILADFKKRGIPYFRYNTDKFRPDGQISIKISNKHNLETELETQYFSLKENEIGLIIIRRPENAAIYSPRFKKWQTRLIDNEWNSVEKYICMNPSAKAVNSPIFSTRARNKISQLEFADAAGLLIPKTLISNNRQEIEKFCIERSLITKGISSCYIEANGITRTGFTKNFGISMISGKLVCPIMLQEKIIPNAIWRIVVIGEKVFSARFVGEELKSIPDSRIILRQLNGEEVITPSSIGNALQKMCNLLNISFCSSDFVENSDGKLFFLDLNPDGQWAWLQLEYNIPVTTGFQNLYEKCSS